MNEIVYEQLALTGRDLLYRRNVWGVGVAWKVTRGVITPTLGVTCYVTHKGRVGARQTIPRKLGAGVVTDVVEMARPQAGPLNLQATHAHRRQRPYRGGAEIAPLGRPWCGTLGGILRAGGKDYGITNWHVARGCPLYCQPAHDDTAIGTLASEVMPGAGYDATLIELDHPAGGLDTQIDRWVGHIPTGAPVLGWPHKHDGVFDHYFNLGVNANPNTGALEIAADTRFAVGLGQATLGAMVRKSGRTTFSTSGRVVAIHALVEVDYSPVGLDPITFSNQLVIQATTPGHIAMPGDSGSLVMDVLSRRVVGLLYAGATDGTDYIAHPIAPTLRVLLGPLLGDDKMADYDLGDGA